MDEDPVTELQVNTQDAYQFEQEYQTAAERDQIIRPSTVIDQQGHGTEYEVDQEVPVVAHLAETQEECNKEKFRTEAVLHLADYILL